MAKSIRDTTERHGISKEREIGKYTMSVAVMLTGIEAHRIRRYEQPGLLKPVRSGAGQRRYTDTEIELIKSIAKLEGEGINQQGVKAILAMRNGERD